MDLKKTKFKHPPGVLFIMPKRSGGMLKRWKALDDLECVKEFGHDHKMAHILGIHSVSKCMTVWGRLATSGFIEGLESREKKEVIAVDKVERFKKNVREFEEWMDTIESIRIKTGDAELIVYLLDIGPKGLPEAKAINRLSDAEIKEYQKLHREYRKLHKQIHYPEDYATKPKKKFVLEFDEAPALIFVSKDGMGEGTLLVNGVEVKGARSITIRAGVDEFTTHEIEYVTAAVK